MAVRFLFSSTPSYPDMAVSIGYVVMRSVWCDSKTISLFLAAVVTAASAAASVVMAASAHAAEVQQAGGLRKVALCRDRNGIAHITAPDEPSMVFAQGYVHARDRLFQMDVLRRTASGTLAELLGPSVISDDIELRTIGLRRAAERTLAALDPTVRTLLTAYTEGVNAGISHQPLPPEYSVLGLTQVQPWTALDTIAIGKLVAFQLSADLDDIDRTQALLGYQAAFGPERGAQLFAMDTWRVAPFEAVATVNPIVDATAVKAATSASLASFANAGNQQMLALAAAWQAKLAAAPRLRRMLAARADSAGSNAFAVSDRLTANGPALLANDPHLDLTVPSVFYPVYLRTIAERIDIQGASFAGVPYVAQGVNTHIAWGVTSSNVDVTDIYEEQLVPDTSSLSGLSTLYRGQREPVVAIPQEFRAFVGGALVGVPVAPEKGGITLIVPRRNNGPIIASLDDGKALSLQWTGFGPSFEIEAFRRLARATSFVSFVKALQRFDVGSQNILYADRSGRIAYYLTGEMPLREDIQQGTPLRPPFIIRDGQGGQEWLPAAKPLPTDQAIPYEILPLAEMPHAVDPESGYLVNANNDPLGDTFDNDALNQTRPGGGIRYLGGDFNMGIRAGRIAALLREYQDRPGKRITLADLQAIQADVTVSDAQVFVRPFILAAFDRVDTASHPVLQALAGDPAIVEAVTRLRRWQQTAPTGVKSGFDAADRDGVPLPMAGGEVAESVATTIFSLWRAQMIANTIDWRLGLLPKPRSRYAIRALRHLLDTFPTAQGVGASGLDFFANPAVLGDAAFADASTRLDVIILRSLRDALDRLASADFDLAFAGSTRLADYRWGRLHRLTADHPLGGPFSLTTPEGPFPPPFAGLPGIPVDGGFETIDRASHDVRAGLAGRGDPVNDFVFSEGPIDRFVARPGVLGNRGENALPGGVSGVLGSPSYANLFGLWLTNEAIRLPPGCEGWEPIKMPPTR